jgi:hypothetical protein
MQDLIGKMPGVISTRLRTRAVIAVRRVGDIAPAIADAEWRAARAVPTDLVLSNLPSSGATGLGPFRPKDHLPAATAHSRL